MKNPFTIVLVTFLVSLTTQAQVNRCVETGPHYGGWSCGSPTLTDASVSALPCVERVPGTPISFPSPTVGWTFTPGTKTRSVSFDCKTGSNQVNTITYNNSGWYYYPDSPPSDGGAGTYTREIRIDYTSSDSDCSFSQTYILGSATWVVQEQSDSEVFCLQSGSLTNVVLSPTVFDICVSNSVNASPSYSIVPGQRGYYHTNACPNSFITVTNIQPYEWWETRFLDAASNSMPATFDTPGSFGYSVVVVIRKPEPDGLACPDYVTTAVGSILVNVHAPGVGSECIGGPTLNNPGVLNPPTLAACVNASIDEPDFATPPTMNAGHTVKYTTNCGPYSVTRETNAVEYAYLSHYFDPPLSTSLAGIWPHTVMGVFQRQGADTNCSQFVTQALGGLTIYVSSTPGPYDYCTQGPTLATGATITPASFLICQGGSITPPSITGVSFSDGSKNVVDFKCDNGTIGSTVTPEPVPFNPGNLRFESFPSFNSTGTFTIRAFADALSTDPACSDVPNVQVGSFTVVVVNNASTNSFCGSPGTVTSTGSITPSAVSVCTGESIPSPTIIPPTVSPGEKHTITVECPSGSSTDVVTRVNYSLQSITCSSSVPSSMTVPGNYTYTYTAVFTASPPDCPPITVQIGTYTVVVVAQPAEVRFCGRSGTVTNSGRLSAASLAVCAGGSIGAPTLASPPGIEPGELHIHQMMCPTLTNIITTIPVGYMLGDLQFSPAWPPTFTNVGTTSFSVSVDAYPDKTNCSPISISLGSVSVEVAPGPSNSVVCAQAGTVVNPGHLDGTNFSICVGGTAAAPGVVGISIRDGTVHQTQTTCPAGTSVTLTNPAVYTVLTNVTVTPPLPATFPSAGVFSYSISMTATSSFTNCAPLTFSPGSFTVQVTNGWTTNYTCVQPGTFSGTPVLSGTNFINCYGSSLQPPGVSGISINDGSYLAAAHNCANGQSTNMILSNSYSLEIKFTPSWPTNGFTETGIHSFSVTAVGHPSLLPNGADCGDISTNVGTVTVLVEKVRVRIGDTPEEQKHNPGSIIFANTDDDDHNQIADLEQPPDFSNFTLPGENDLIPCTLVVQGNITNDVVTLSLSASSGRIRLWSSATKGTILLDSGTIHTSVQWPLNAMPSSVYVEGMGATAQNSVITLTLSTSTGCSDSAGVTVVSPVIQYIYEGGVIDEVQYEADPRPSLELHLDGSPSLDDFGNLTVNVSGRVTDPLSDLAFYPGQRVQSVNIRMNGVIVDSVPNLAATVTNWSWPWHPCIFDAAFHRTYVFKNPGGAAIQLHAETSPNAAGRTAWSELRIALGWTEVGAFYPGLSSHGGGSGGSLATAPLNIVFSSFPTNTLVDRAKIYFGNRTASNTDGTVLETGTNTMSFAGMFQSTLTNTFFPVQVSISSFTYTNGSTNFFDATIHYQISTNDVYFTGRFKESSPGSLRFVHQFFSDFVGSGIELQGSSTEYDGMIIPVIDSVEELGSNPDGWIQPAIVKVTGLVPEIASLVRLNINGTSHRLVSFTNGPGEYYIANPSNPDWPRIFVNKPNSIPGATLPNMTVVEEMPDQPSLNIYLTKPDGGEIANFSGDIYEAPHLPVRPPSPVGSFSRSDLLSHFEFYNRTILAGQVGPIPGHAELSWADVYGRMLTNFIAQQNQVDVDNLWFAGFDLGRKAKISWIFGGHVKIVVDHSHQSVWSGVFHLHNKLETEEAQAYTPVTPDGDPNAPEYVMDEYLMVQHRWASLKEGAHDAQLLANLELTAATTVIPGGELALTVNQVAEGDPIAIAQAVLKLRGMKRTSIASAPPSIKVGKIKAIHVDIAPANWPTINMNRTDFLDFGQNPTAKEIRKAILKEIRNRKTGFATAADEAVFYSGRLEHYEHNGMYAYAYVQSNPGKKTISNTPSGEWLEAQVQKVEQDFGTVLSAQEMGALKTAVWNFASHYFAKQAKGRVVAFVGGAQPGRTYLKYELPRLTKNGDVTEILQVVFPTQ